MHSANTNNLNNLIGLSWLQSRKMPANTHITPEDNSGGQNPGQQLKNLYLGKSIEDLNSQAKVQCIQYYMLQLF